MTDLSPGGGIPTEAEHELVGVPDGFDRLWTPHRMAYITGERPSRDAGDGCPFCTAPEREDAGRRTGRTGIRHGWLRVRRRRGGRPCARGARCTR